MQYDDPNADLLSDLLSRLERRANLRDERTELDQIQKELFLYYSFGAPW